MIRGVTWIFGSSHCEQLDARRMTIRAPRPAGRREGHRLLAGRGWSRIGGRIIASLASPPALGRRCNPLRCDAPFRVPTVVRGWAGRNPLWAPRVQGIEGGESVVPPAPTMQDEWAQERREFQGAHLPFFRAHWRRGAAEGGASLPRLL